MPNTLPDIQQTFNEEWAITVTYGRQSHTQVYRGSEVCYSNYHINSGSACGL